jgi:prepilin-type N-terminal cleavage/methylation domain-containing protein
MANSAPITASSNPGCDASNGARARRSDAGFTLPELLISVMVSGILIAVISTALLVVLRTAPQAEARLSESKDVTFLNAWIPVDLSTAVSSWDDVDDSVVRAGMLARTPAMTYNASLPGVNILTLVLPDGNSGGFQLVSYRYEQLTNGEWRISRYLILAPGTASETLQLVGVAYEVPNPPAGWVPADGVSHAVVVTSRNQAAAGPVGEDVTVIFQSGNEFTTGGAGLSDEQDLTPLDPTTLPDPTAPPTRCGGRIAMVIDTSGSVPASNGGVATEVAAIGFIEAFVGTPTQISLNGFDREGYAMVNDPAIPLGDANVAKFSKVNERAEFHSVLDVADPNVAMMIDRVERLDNLDNAWPGGGAAIGARDPNGDRAMWDQIGAGTNWEDGLYNIFFNAATGQPHNSYQPDLVVFITDGQPGLRRDGSGGVTGSGGQSAAVQAAAVVANDGRGQGSRVIGVIVGNGASNTSLLTDVVGDNAWSGSVRPDGSIDAGNAISADYFAGSFSDLGGVLRSLMIAECGGTVTLRKQLDDTTVPPGVWSYSSPTGGRVLDTASQSSITFDFNFENGDIEQIIRITEEARSGYTFLRGDCSVAGAALDPSLVVQRPDGEAAVDVTVRPDQAVSCVMVSERNP